MSLRFLVPGKDGTYESGYLEDVHITPHLTSNSLLISAPKETLDLLEAVIKNLDVPAATQGPGQYLHAQASGRGADREHAAAALYRRGPDYGRGRRRSAADPEDLAAPVEHLAAGAAGAAGSQLRPLLTASGQIGEGAGLIDLRISVDDRTNSIIVAATQNDLDAIRAIIYRLENADYSRRAVQVIKLHNAAAADVASVLQSYLTQSLTVYTTGVTSTNYLQITKNIIVQPEPVTNNLLIDAHAGSDRRLDAGH